MDLGAHIGAKIDEAVDAYDGSTESVKENIETIDDALAVSEERQRWKQAINDIKAELAKAFWCDDDARNKADNIIDKHTKELMQ